MIKFKTKDLKENFDMIRSEFLNDSAKNEWVDSFMSSVTGKDEFEGSIVTASCLPSASEIVPYNIYFQTRSSDIVHDMAKILDKNNIAVDLTDFYVGSDLFLEDFVFSNKKPYDNFFWVGFNFSSGRKVVKFYFCFSGCDNYFDYLLKTYHNTTLEDFKKTTGIEKQDQRFVTYYFEDGKPVSAVVKMFINDEYKKSPFITSAKGLPVMESALRELSVDSIQLKPGSTFIEEVYFLTPSIASVEKYINNALAYSEMSRLCGAVNGDISYIGINDEKVSVAFLPRIDYCRDKIEMSVTGSAERINEVDSLIESRKFEEAENLCLDLIGRYGDGNGLNYRLGKIYSKGCLNKVDLAIHYFAKERSLRK